MPFEDRKRRTGEILESVPRSVQRGHQEYEPTDPPPPIREPWGEPIEGVGSPSVMIPPRRSLDREHKAFTSVWGIILILIGAAAGGWGARAFAGDYVTKAQLDAQEKALKEIQASIASVRETQIGMQKDIDWMKDTLRSAQAPEPLEVKRKR